MTPCASSTCVSLIFPRRANEARPLAPGAVTSRSMAEHQQADEAAPPSAAQRLDEIRARMVAGERMRGTFAAAVHAATTAADPSATEDTLATLPGNGGMHLYHSLIAWAAPLPASACSTLAAEAEGRAGSIPGIAWQAEQP